ncbi:putative No apical meristem-associated domain-containing protein [Helianthus annuus]|uniref:No apical meristem-associated domain-containing protein n=1 Tax=Helianthus annuus TaxID=4232 RepID=A0A9K3NIU9_HELAN|nr:putative No apical meristem-associated domain-containing protein [Helianthus annuus]KAJ0560081.1 putative No apical meristem-associated domain-containing protein [Helianthus annuus]KAJ0566309.1 putative No apical meristem-associated domain-containing protein [Helianthus annuus]KAJ0573075.1 putative No apical meristem-associated domain-containing protein [Helianthus annuus]KAJ0740378.1 putative No apical meristem-associated domain-containing protein [Helianthus annuus]
MNPFNRGFIPPRSSGNPTRPVAPVPTRPNPFGSGFLDYNQQSPGFMNLLNQPLSWDPNLYGWNPSQNMDGLGLSQAFGSAQAFGSPLHEPDVVPETQPEVPDTQPETQKGKGKAKRAHKKKVETNTRTKKNVQTWEPEEEYALTRAFIDVSEDPVIGIQRLYSGWKSGSSDEDITQEALVEYTEANGHFPYMKCWQILRHSPKWAVVTTPSGRSGNTRPSKRSKTNESGEPETPTSDARNIGLDEDIPDDEPVEELPRPPGRKSRAKKPESSSMSMGTDMSHAFSEINKRLQDIHELGNKRLEENEKVTEIMRDRQWAHDFDFYSKPHDHLTGKALKMALAQKERIEKKYNL